MKYTLVKTIHIIFFNFESKFFFLIAAIIWGCVGMAGGAVLGKYEETTKLVRYACESDLKLTTHIDNNGNKIYECTVKSRTPKF